MKRNYFKKGFTIIELLVAVGIIVILAALIIVNINQARMSGRDSKRIADVSSIQLALEMFRNSNGEYPTEESNWAAATGVTVVGDPGFVEQTNWDVLSTELSPYISPLPKDPLNKEGGYRYYVDMNFEQTGAIIKTKLEVNPEKMAEDSCPTNVDYYDIISGSFTDGIDPGNGQNHCTDLEHWAYPTI